MEKGGAQKAMLTLASELDKSKFEVIVSTMYDKESFIPYYESLYDLKIINLQMKEIHAGKLKNLFNFVRGLFRIWRLIKINQIEIVQSYSHYPNIIIPIISFFAGVNNRYTSQRMSLDYLSGIVKALDKLIANSFFVTKIISVSEGTKESCIRQGIKEEKLLVIPNGIKLHDQLVSQEEILTLKKKLDVDHKFVISMVGRLHRQKGHSYFIEAMKKIKSKDLTVLLIGDGELREELEQEIRDNNLEDIFQFLGSRNDVPQLLQISDIFILPSLWEGMPNSVLEAMSYGLPIIATDVDGTPELITHQESGLLIKPGVPDEISEAIELLMSDSELREMLSQNAKNRAENYFSLKRTVGSYEKLYLGNGA